MQFSLKWLLAGVVYAAIVCASVIYAGQGWMDATTIFVAATCVVAAIAACLRRGAVQAFWIGFLIASLMGHVGIFSNLKATSAVRRSIEHLTDRLEAVVPTRRGVVREYIERTYQPTEDLGDELSVGVHAEGVVVKFSQGIQGFGFNPAGEGKSYVIPASVYRGIPLEYEVASVAKQHLLLLLSLIGGFLGWWCYQRQAKADGTKVEKA